MIGLKMLCYFFKHKMRTVEERLGLTKAICDCCEEFFALHSKYPDTYLKWDNDFQNHFDEDKKVVQKYLDGLKKRETK